MHKILKVYLCKPLSDLVAVGYMDSNFHSLLYKCRTAESVTKFVYLFQKGSIQEGQGNTSASYLLYYYMLLLFLIGTLTGLCWTFLANLLKRFCTVSIFLFAVPYFHR